MSTFPLLSLLVTVLIAGCVFYLLVWLIGWIGLEEPFAKVAKVIIGVIAILFLIGILTGHVPRIAV